MLDALRKGAGTWVAKIFIALLVFSFAIWGVADVFQNGNADSVARVGTTDITAQEFQAAYDRELRQLGQRLGRPLTPAEGAAVGLPNQVLGRLAGDAALTDIARTMNVGISDQELAKIIQTDPAFRGLTGAFDRQTLQQYLYNVRMSEDQYVEQRRRQAERIQVANGLAGGIKAPQVFVDAANQYQLQQRVVRFLSLSPDMIEDPAAPDETTLTTYYDANKSSYGAPEFRRVEYLLLDPESLAKPDEVTDEDAKQDYDAANNQYITPEKRLISQIVFPDAESAQAAGDKIKAGSSFTDILTERNITAEDASLGLMEKGKLIDKAVDEAAFAMTEPGVSGVIDGRFGPVIIDVSEIQVEAKTPFEEVKTAIKQAIATDRAQQEVLDLHDEVEDARAGGAKLAEVVGRFGLKINKPNPVSRQGNDLEGNAVELPEKAEMISESFDSDVGIENDPIQVGLRGFVWFEVMEVIAARDRPLDEVKEQVATDWIAAEKAKSLTELADTTVERLKQGDVIEMVAAGLGTEARTTESFSRSTGQSDLSQAAVVAAFSGPEGTVTNTLGNDGNQVVLQIVSVTEPTIDPANQTTEQIKTRLDGTVQQSLLNQYIQTIESELGFTVNQQVLGYVLGLDNGANHSM